MYRNFLAEMTRNGYTREFIANQLNLSLPSFRKKMNGEADFKISEINKILSLFGSSISYEYLFEKD